MKAILELVTHSGTRIPDQTVEFESLPAVGTEIYVKELEAASVEHPGCNARLIVCDVGFVFRKENGAFVPVVTADAFGDAAGWADQVLELAKQYEPLQPLAALIALYRSEP